MKTTDAIRVLQTATLSQQGLITTAQASRLGVNRTTLTRLVAKGHLIDIRRGVHGLPYSIRDDDQDLRAAWLSTEPSLFADERAGAASGIVVSHDSACTLHRLGDLIPNAHQFTTPRRRQTRQKDIRYHVRALAPAEITVVDGIVVTSIPRTVSDLAAERTDEGHLAAIVRDALSTSRTSTTELAAALDPAAPLYGHPNGEAFVGACLEIAGLPQAVADWTSYRDRLSARARQEARHNARSSASRAENTAPEQNEGM